MKVKGTFSKTYIALALFFGFMILYYAGMNISIHGMLNSIRLAITVATSPNRSSNETISESKMSLLTLRTPPTVSMLMVSVIGFLMLSS